MTTSVSEKAFTQRATRLPIEYNYTNADIHYSNNASAIGQISPQDGYEFDYPVNWRGDPSLNKVIGLRRISYKPCSISLTYDITFKYTIDEEKEASLHGITGVFTSQNTFEESITRVKSDIIDACLSSNIDPRIVMIVNYDKIRGNVDISFVTEKTAQHESVNVSFKFEHMSDEQISEWLRLFNQPVTNETITEFKNNYCDRYALNMNFDNVWNRDDFYCHASFSDSPRKVIGLNNDFWMQPSVLYAAVDNSNDFTIYFTTDTVHRILPRNGILLVQISYIFNYLTSTALM